MPLVLIFMFSSFPKSAFPAKEVAVGRGDAGFQVDPRLPAKIAKAPRVEQLSRRSIRLGRVVLQGAAKSDHRRHGPREVRDGLIFAAADVDQGEPIGAVQ